MCGIGKGDKREADEDIERTIRSGGERFDWPRLRLASHRKRKHGPCDWIRVEEKGDSLYLVCVSLLYQSEHREYGIQYDLGRKLSIRQTGKKKRKKKFVLPRQIDIDFIRSEKRVSLLPVPLHSNLTSAVETLSYLLLLFFIYNELV